MKKGCAVGFFTWIVSAAVYWYLLRSRLNPPAIWNVSIIGGAIMMIAIGQLRAAFVSAREAKQLSSDALFTGATGERPKDGEAITATGRIRALGPSLKAPFSGKPAVFYSYDIKHVIHARREVTQVEDYSGYALTPSVIDTQQGPIRLFGIPLLEKFPKEELESEVARRNAESWIAGTQFTRVKFGNVYRELKDMLTGAGGEACKDFRLTDDTDLAGKQLYEQVVAPGEQVCVIGRYSAEKGGVVPDLESGQIVQLLRGGAGSAAGSLWWRTTGAVVTGLIIAAAGNFGLFFYLNKLGSRSPVEVVKTANRQPVEPIDLHRAVKAADRVTMGMLVQQGIEVDARDEDGRTPLMIATDEQTAKWLIEHRANVNAVDGDGNTVLMDQAVAGNAAIVTELIHAGASVDAVNMTWKTTALMQALDNEKLDVAEILRKAGARDDTVTEKNGWAIDAKSEQARICLDYLDAMQREDARAMARLVTWKMSEKPDFKTLKESRPLHGSFSGGFANGNGATIVIRGICSDGLYRTHTYQLFHGDDGWKISGERWETRFDSKQP